MSYSMWLHYASKVGMVIAAWMFDLWIGLAALMHAIQTTSLTFAVNKAQAERERDEETTA